MIYFLGYLFVGFVLFNISVAKFVHERKDTMIPGRYGISQKWKFTDDDEAFVSCVCIGFFWLAILPFYLMYLFAIMIQRVTLWTLTKLNTKKETTERTTTSSSC